MRDTNTHGLFAQCKKCKDSHSVGGEEDLHKTTAGKHLLDSLSRYYVPKALSHYFSQQKHMTLNTMALLLKCVTLLRLH